MQRNRVIFKHEAITLAQSVQDNRTQTNTGTGQERATTPRNIITRDLAPPLLRRVGETSPRAVSTTDKPRTTTELKRVTGVANQAKAISGF
jgi:hypothetical protein